MKIDLEISLRRLGKVVDGMQDAAATSWPGPDTGGTCSAGAVSGQVAIGRLIKWAGTRRLLQQVTKWSAWAEVAS